MLSTTNPLKFKDKLKVKDGERYVMITLILKKESEINILISDKTHFRARKTVKDRKGHYIIIEGPIIEQDIAILNLYVSHRESKYMEAKMYRTARKSGQIHSYSWRYQHSSISNEQIQQAEYW